MKKKLMLSTLLLSLIIWPSVSLAREDEADDDQDEMKATSTEVRIRTREEYEAKKQEIEQQRELLKAEIEAKRETIKDEIEQRREKVMDDIRDRLDNFIDKIVDRFDASIERLEKLAQRIESRISKYEAEGINVTKSKELLVIAKTKIETAKTSVAALETETLNVIGSNATTTTALKADFNELKSQLEKAKKDIKAAHTALVDVIENLKPGLNKNDSLKKATTTTATTTEDN